MKKLIWLVDTSLDGYMSGPNGELDWLGADVDDEFWMDVNALLGTVDATLFGRATYQNFEQYWPAVPGNPASPKNEVEFSKWIERTPKQVASTTLSSLSWKNSILLDADIASSVSKMKEGKGKDVLMFGSCNLAAQLFEANLIDELQIRIHPIVLGVGRLAFRNGIMSHRLKLVHAKTFGSGVIGLRYEL